MKKYLAEGLGAGALTLVVGLSLQGSFPVATPMLAALTLGLFVYSIGHISGTHINPAVTIGAWSIGKISTRVAALYVVAQCAGALVALFTLSLVTTPITLTITNSLMIGVAELIGTFFFTFGIASVIYNRTPSLLSGFVVGGSLLLGVALSATMGAGGILNPAVALGIGSFGVMYVLGPIVGAVLGMQAYRYLSE